MLCFFVFCSELLAVGSWVRAAVRSWVCAAVGSWVCVNRERRFCFARARASDFSNQNPEWGKGLGRCDG